MSIGLRLFGQTLTIFKPFSNQNPTKQNSVVPIIRVTNDWSPQVSLASSRLSILAPTKDVAARLAEALAWPRPPRWLLAPERITREDDLIILTGWQQSSAAACAAARAQTTVPIVLLVPDTSTKIILEGLHAGADLVLPDTTDAAELQARLRALLRRQRTPYRVGVSHIPRIRDSTS